MHRRGAARLTPAPRYRLGVQYSYTPPTAAEFRALYDETGWGAWDLERFDRALAGSWVVCSARDEVGRLVGIGRLISDGALHAFVTEMIVSEGVRGKGVGGEVLARLVAEARRRGVEDVQLFAARGRATFSEQHGFVRRHEDGPGMDLDTALATSAVGGWGDGDASGVGGGGSGDGGRNGDGPVSRR